MLVPRDNKKMFPQPQIFFALIHKSCVAIKCKQYGFIGVQQD